MMEPPPPPVEAPRILAFDADPAAFEGPATTTLSWRTTNAKAVTLTRDGLEVDAELELEGNWTSAPLERTTRFSLQATGDGGTAVEDLEVVVTPPPPPPSIETFEVFPPRFDGPEAEVSLTWRGVGALTLDANGRPVPEFPGNEASFWLTTVREATVFTLTASSAGQSVTAEAVVRRSGVELEPNDDRGGAGFLDADGRAVGRIEPADVDWYAFEVPAQGAVSARVVDADGGCRLDSQLELWGPDPERPGQVRFLALADDGPEDACATLDPAREPAAVDLSAGTHYVSVRGFDNDAVGDYVLTLQVVEGRCGNGLVEISRGEQCDRPGDDRGACGPDCRFEAAAAVSGPDASERRIAASGATELVVPVELSRDAVARFSFRDDGGRCPGEPVLRLLDPDESAGAELVAARVGTCTLDARPTRAGTYLLSLARSDLAEPLPSGELGLAVQSRGCGDRLVDPGEACDDGNQVDGDGCSPTCTLQSVGAGPGTVQLSEVDDRPRFIAVDVATPGSAVTASVTVGAPSEVRLSLHDESFLEITDTFPGSPLTRDVAGADDLAAGRYYVGVSRVVPGPGIGVRTEVLDPQCGDGRVQARGGEQCDDGPQDLDGCDRFCRFRVEGPAFSLPGRVQPTGLTVPATGRLVLELSTSTTANIGGFSFHPGFGCDAPAPDILQLELLGPDLRTVTVLGPTQTPNACPAFSPNVPIGAGRHFLLLRTTLDRALEPVTLNLSVNAARCGDRIVDVDEECDDGNFTSGDGCDRCRIEGGFGRESEPNDAFAGADPVGARIGGGLVQFIGAVEPRGRDLYVVELGRWQEADLYVRTRQPGSSRCFAIDTALRVFDASGRVLDANDDIGQFDACSEILLTGNERPVEGRYFIEVAPGQAVSSVPQYRLDVEWR